jgi:peptidoglycan-associated lipoprotein
MTTMTVVRNVATMALAVLVALGLAACSSPVKLDEDAGAPVESRTPTPGGAGAAGAAGATTGTAAQSQVASVDLGRNDASASAVARVIYFDFDSYVVKPEYRPVIEANARRLNADRNLRVIVEGHTDERGGREYNLALGQKRAEAVARSLTLLGVAEVQVEAVSFGEERPEVAASTEDAWSRNRRAVIRDR